MEPGVVTEVAAVAQQALLADRRRNIALPRIVAHVMIAENGARRDIEVGMTARANARSSSRSAPSKLMSPVLTTRSGRSVEMMRAIARKFGANQDLSRPRCVSET